MNEHFKEIADKCFSTLPDDSELEKYTNLIIEDFIIGILNKLPRSPIEYRDNIEKWTINDE